MRWTEEGGGAMGVHTHLETHLPAPVSDREEKVALSVPSPEEFIPHLVPDVEQIVGVLACILEQVMWKWPARPAHQEEQGRRDTAGRQPQKLTHSASLSHGNQASS